jgi:hypothetical protein
VYQPQNNEMPTMHKALADENSHRYYHETKKQSV